MNGKTLSVESGKHERREKREERDRGEKREMRGKEGPDTEMQCSKSWLWVRFRGDSVSTFA